MKRGVVLSLFWVVQAAVIVLGHGLIMGVFGAGGVDLSGVRGLFMVVSDNPYAPWMFGIIGVLTVLQGMIVLPWAAPMPRRARGKPVLLSLAASGLLIAGLIVSFVCAFSELAVLHKMASETGWFWPAIWFGLGFAWACATPLLVAYSARSALTNNDLVTRVSRLVFAGTVVEAIALIPLDVMVRRKTDCYCWSGSFLVLNLCGAIGLVVAGPAFLLPLLAKRSGSRRRRVGVSCEWCGYDLRGSAGVCPECGRERAGEP